MEKQIWKTAFSLDEINERAMCGLSEHLSIRFTDKGNNFLKAIMPVLPTTKQPMGCLHGGASCALAETVASAAANYCVDQTNFICMGLDLNINHIRTVQSGFITAIAIPFHLGKTTQVWDIKIFDELEKLVAISRLTVAVIAKKEIRNS